MPRRILFGLVVGFSPWLGGCFIPYAYPTCSRCPGTTLPATDEVVAVVVNAAWSISGTTPRPHEAHTFRRTELTAGEVRPQSHVCFSYGYLLFLGIIADTKSGGEYVMTKLYRRGYKTVVLEPGGGPASVVSEAAVTPEDREAAVRALVYRCRRHWSGDHEANPAPGSTDPRHKEVLLFAAAEFDRVADLYTPDSEGRARCRAEAETLRRRSAE